ncbi:MAG TPA: PAS domain S-box protein [Holophagaceae bacterium]
MPLLPPFLRRPGRLAAALMLALGIPVSLGGFFLAREAHRSEVQASFQTVAQYRAELVSEGLQHGFETVLVLRDFMEAGPVDREAFQAFAGPVLSRRPYLQALQWLPEVDPGNRAALEAEARRAYAGFRFFGMDARGKPTPLPQDATFHAVDFVAPLSGNEPALGFCARHLATREEALARALETGTLSSSGRIRLIQETADQNGLLVMASVPGRAGRPPGVVQGVFRTGDLVHKSLAGAPPEGVVVRLIDGSAPAAESVLHIEPSPLPPRESGDSSLRLVHGFDQAGRHWRVLVTPAPGYFVVGAGLRAWGVLAGSLAFFGLLAGYLRTLLARQAEVHTLVEARTRELAEEVASHRQDAEALRASEARFRHLVEVMGEGMWVLDPEGNTTFVNRRMREILGYSPEEMTGRPLTDFMFAEDFGTADRNMAQRRAGVGSQHDFRFRRKDGSEVWTIVTANPVKDETGRVVSVLGMITDITERRRIEEAQLQSQKLESLGVLAGGIAHDFNNLLTAILGNINLAQLCLPRISPAWPYLENLEKSVHRATNLTRQMLAYSGRGRFVMAPMDLNQAVEEMAHLLGVSISKKVALRFQLQPGLPAMMAEASQIQQVIMNLVTNASEAIGEAEGLVAIRTGTQAYTAEDLARDFPGQALAPGTFLVLEVSDNGQGMDAETQARIFEPFFTTKFTGRGLGLSAIQGIVRGHRGGIRVYSELGKGTTFKLIFPAGSDPVPATTPAEETESWQGSGTLLVVDDEEEVRTIAEALLRSLGFEVVLAADGLEALEAYRKAGGKIRAVLMDLTMPHMDGVETFRELRRLDPDCRVILTSGYNEQEAIHEFLGKGLAGFVQKPFLRDDLSRALRKALEDGPSS